MHKKKQVTDKAPAQDISSWPGSKTCTKCRTTCEGPDLLPGGVEVKVTCARCGTDLLTFGVNPKTDDLHVICMICHSTGPDGESECQAVLRWNIQQTAVKSQLTLAL